MRAPGIYKFDINRNLWKQIYKYDKYFLCNIISASYDDKDKLLYICNVHNMRYSQLITFDIQNQKKLSAINCKSKRFELIFVNNKLNQIINFPIQSEKNGNHYVFNNNNKTSFTRLTFCNYLSDLYGFKLIYLKQKQCVLLFGGRNSNNTISNSIWKFDCLHSIWSELDITMPKPLQLFGLIATHNQRFIILFGGETRSKLLTRIFKGCNCIWIYDTKTNIWIKSQVRCPVKSKFTAINMIDIKRDELLTSGYVQHCYKNANFVNVVKLPHYLIKMIDSYHCQEHIYLLETFTGSHWKMNIDCILNKG